LRFFSFCFHLLFDPKHQQIDNLFLLAVGQRFVFWYLIPFIKAVAAATGAGVLGNEYGMTAHGRLLSVVWNVSRGKAGSDKILAVRPNGFDPLIFYILPILFA
jgi:hypothetical protein